MGCVRTIGDREAHLDTYLRPYGASREALAAEADGIYGDPVLVMASGSVPVGYFNAKSDLDMYAVVTHPSPSEVPLVSQTLGPVMDVYFLQEDELVERLATLEQDGELGDDDDPPGRWLATFTTLDLAARLAVGVALTASDEWRDRLRAVDDEWLLQRAAEFWQAEAWRHAALATLLRERRPIHAAQIAVVAGLTALKHTTAAAGFGYANFKWVGRELRELPDTSSLRRYRELMALACRADDPEATVDLGLAVMAAEAGAPPPSTELELVLLDGVERREVGHRTLFSRWDLHGALIEDVPDRVDQDLDGAYWRGPIGEDPPSWAIDLAAASMAWPGVRRGAG